ncbi:hypothetical protein, partial [Mycobacterium timonense]
MGDDGESDAAATAAFGEVFHRAEQASGVGGGALRDKDIGFLNEEMQRVAVSGVEAFSEGGSEGPG